MPERQLDSVEQLHALELEGFRSRAEAGCVIEIAAALHYCAKHKLDAPQWVLGHASNLLCATLRGDMPKKRGRSTGLIDRHRQDYVDYIRWDTTKEIQEQRCALIGEISVVRKVRGRKAADILSEREKTRLWAGTNDRSAFESASILLRETIAAGGPDAIQKSYRKVERNLCDPATAARYYLADLDFLRAIGIDPVGLRARKKIEHLYNLT